MVSQLTGTVFNLVFDPLLIFGLAGFPKMGIAGAAVATVLGQFAAMFVSFTLNIKKNKEIHLSFKGLKPEGKIIGNIYAVGVPSIIVCSIGSILVYFLNIILGAFSTTAIAVSSSSPEATVPSPPFTEPPLLPPTSVRSTRGATNSSSV